MEPKYYVYIVECNDNSFYTGIATDVKRRISEHNNDNKKASKYIISRRPVKLVYKKKYKSRSDASKIEYKIKQLNREEKKKLIINNVKIKITI